MASIGGHNLDAAINQLRAFQHRIQAAKLDPDTTVQLSLQVQSITDALGAGQTSYASELLTGQWSYFKPSQALADLIQTVGDSHIQDNRALIEDLADALVSVGEKDTNAAARRLCNFQGLVRVTWMNSKLAAQLIFESQRIINALGGAQDMKHCHLRAYVKGGRPCLEFSGEKTATYTVEASTDMVHWQEIGAAKSTGNGNFEFEDEHAKEFPFRYYRIVSP